jgi:hypothetical protein
VISWRQHPAPHPPSSPCPRIIHSCQVTWLLIVCLSYMGLQPSLT